MGRSPGAGDNHLDAPLCGLAGVLRCPVGRAVRRSNVNLVSDPKIVETLARLLHDLEIGVTAHDNRNHRFVHRFLTPDSSTRCEAFEPRCPVAQRRKTPLLDAKTRGIQARSPGTGHSLTSSAPARQYPCGSMLPRTRSALPPRTRDSRPSSSLRPGPSPPAPVRPR